jgi:hypothetical protein
MLGGILYLAFVLAALLLGWRFWRSVRDNPRVRQARKASEVYYFTSTDEPVEEFFATRRLWSPGRVAPALVFWLSSLWVFLSSLELILNPAASLLNFLLSVVMGFPLVFLSMVWVAKN